MSVFERPALAYVNGLVARVLMVVVGVILVGVAVVTASALGQPVHSKVGTQKRMDTPFLFYHAMFTFLRFSTC